MRVGLISDPHGLLRLEAIAALRGVDRILHAGDIGGREVIDALAAVAPIDAVRGNNDRDALAHAPVLFHPDAPRGHFERFGR
jgi:hypothetical protein